MKDECLESYIYKILQKDYRFNLTIVAYTRPKFMYVKTQMLFLQRILLEGCQQIKLFYFSDMFDEAIQSLNPSSASVYKLERVSSKSELE